jgi:hypothetical protein
VDDRPRTSDSNPGSSGYARRLDRRHRYVAKAIARSRTGVDVEAIVLSRMKAWS